MQHPSARVPVYVVTGATGAGKSTFIRTLYAARPAAEHWAVINNDTGPLPVAEDDASPPPVTIGGCVCCTGRMMLQTAMVKLLRRTRPSRLIIEASAVAEPAALERTLQDEFLTRTIEIRLRLCMAPAAWTAYPLPARARLLEQMRAADYVTAHDAATMAALRATLVNAGVADGKFIQLDEALRLALASPAPDSSASSRRILS